MQTLYIIPTYIPFNDKLKSKFFIFISLVYLLTATDHSIIVCMFKQSVKGYLS